MIRNFDFGPLGLGILTAAGGFGSLLGAGLVGRITRRFGVGACITGAHYLAAPATFALPLASAVPAAAGFGLLLFDQLFGDVMWMVHNVTAMSLRQAITPRPQLGRVNATMLLASQGLRPIGALVAGFAATSIGVREALFVAVIGINISWLWLVFSPITRLRLMPEPVESRA